MFLKYTIYLLIIHISVGQLDKLNWDLAVTNNNGIMVLTSDGTYIDATAPFSHLKALTYNNFERMFIVSDMNDGNDTIYPISLGGNPDIEDIHPIVKNIPDDIQNLAFDPTTMTVYWADAPQRAIKFIPIDNKPVEKPQVLIKFDNKEPQHVVIHSCKRHLFFTNSLYISPSIERIDLITQEHTILVDTDLETPVGITIDYMKDRIYWSDWGPGIYFRIESANLDGTDRKIIVADTYQQPFGLAVDTDFIYWTDITSDTLWKANKKESFNKNQFYKLRTFEQTPLGLLSNYLGFAGTPSCTTVTKLISEFSTCSNNGKQIGNGCSCKDTSSLNDCLEREFNINTDGSPDSHCHGGRNDACDNSRSNDEL